MLRMISDRCEMPHTVGTSPTALYGSIIRTPKAGTWQLAGAWPIMPHAAPGGLAEVSG